MNLNIKVEQHDLLTDDIQTYEARADVFEDGYLVYRTDNKMYKINISEEELLINYVSKLGMTKLYAKCGKGECVVSNSVGDMCLKLFVCDSFIADDVLKVEYQLLQQDEIVSHFLYCWRKL